MAAALARALAGVISRVISVVNPVISGRSPVIGDLNGPKFGREALKLRST
jgi:hypothetical protein